MAHTPVGPDNQTVSNHVSMRFTIFSQPGSPISQWPMPGSTYAVARAPYSAAILATVLGGLMRSSLPVSSSSGAETA